MATGWLGSPGTSWLSSNTKRKHKDDKRENPEKNIEILPASVVMGFWKPQLN